MRDPSNKDHIIEVATQLFYERGFHGTNMREIGDQVGIRAASIYNHFSSKEEILFVISLGSIQELYELGRSAVSAHADPADQLRALIRAHVIYHARNRRRAKVSDDQLHALAPEHLHHVMGVRDEYESLLKGALTRGRAEQGWQVPDVSVVTFALATMGTAVGVWFREDGRLSAEQVADIFESIAINAVASGRIVEASAEGLAS